MFIIIIIIISIFWDSFHFTVVFLLLHFLGGLNWKMLWTYEKSIWYFMHSFPKNTFLRVLENELNRFDELAEIIQSQGMGHMTR